MRPSVYIETSVIGYLAMRPSAHLVTAANQQVTREFRDEHRSRFDLFVSLSVVDECMAGDTEAAAEREVFLRGIPVLVVSSDVLSLAQELMTGLPLPERAAVDAVHIAVAALNGLDYLVTWNCKHIAIVQRCKRRDHSMAAPARVSHRYLLKVKLKRAKRIWRTIALPGDHTLEDFHRAIFMAFDRYDPHG